MVEMIREALAAAGLPEIPDSKTAALADYGMDSLVMVLSVIEFEKLFEVKIPANEFSADIFQSLESIENFLRLKGVK